jgi:hypothetical protein
MILIALSDHHSAFKRILQMTKLENILIDTFVLIIFVGLGSVLPYGIIHAIEHMS